jgi:hypothetical protein
MRAVEAARLAVDRFKQVDAPDGLTSHDRDRGVDGALQLAPFEHPQLEPDAVFRSFLSLVRIGVEKVQVADDDADLLEDERLEHVLNHPSVCRPRPAVAGRGTWEAVSAVSHYHPASDQTSTRE